MAAAAVETSAKATKGIAKPKKSSVAAASKKPRSHPTYHEMVKEALEALKERSGSSVIAIARHMEEKHKNLPPNFKKLLYVQIKKLVASGKLVKVKNSFKLPSKTVSSSAGAKKPVEKKKRKAGADKPEKPNKVAKTPQKKKKAATKVVNPPVKKAVKSVKSPAKKVKSVKSPAKKVKAVKNK